MILFHVRLGPGHFLTVNVGVGPAVVGVLASVCGGGCLTDGDVGNDRVVVGQVAGGDESTRLVDKVELIGILSLAE